MLSHYFRRQRRFPLQYTTTDDIRLSVLMKFYRCVIFSLKKKEKRKE